VLARHLLPSEFGVAATALVIIGFSQIFSQLGVGPALVQKKEASQKDINSINTISILLGFALFSLSYLYAADIASFFAMRDLENALKTLSPCFIISGLLVAPESLLKRSLQFKKIAISHAASYFAAYAILAPILAINGAGLFALVLAHLTQETIRYILTTNYNKIPVQLTYDLRPAYPLLNYGLGFSLAKTANYLATKSDQLIISKMLGANDLGFYTRANEFLMAPVTILGTAVDKVLFPAMSKHQNNKVKLERSYYHSLAAISIISIPLSSYLILNSDILIRVLLGDSWENVALPFAILASILVFRAGYKISDCTARSLGAVYQRAWRQWVYLFMIILGSITGQNWGLSGVASGVAFAIFLNYALMSSLTKKLIGISYAKVTKIHARHLIFTLPAIIATFLISGLMGEYIQNDVTLLGLQSAPFLALALLLVFRPDFFGKEAIWLKEQISRALV